MPPKKAIAFGKIGSFGQLTIGSNRDTNKDGDDNGGFGKFGKNDDEFVSEPTKAVEEAMGFQGFGKGKVSRDFNLDSLLEESKLVARERNQKKIAEMAANAAADEAAKREEEANLIGPPMPMPPPAVPSTSPKIQKKPKDEDADSDEDSDDSDEDDLEKGIPASLEVNLNHGTKPVSALSVDHAGARLVTGSVDYDVKLWDFAGMNSSLQSFRTIRPCEW